ncbi:hypothetical protein [Shewanella ulleungensis]|uniref:hypothetical protein n=1 Tax=Shewanella ulleungensis TaxID=2282699 RepID=UPI003D79B99A
MSIIKADNTDVMWMSKYHMILSFSIFSIFSVLMLMNLLGAISLFVVVTFNRPITQQSYYVTLLVVAKE